MKRSTKSKAKAKAKAGNRKLAKPKPLEKVTPTYLAKGASIRIGLYDVIKAVKMIEKHDHLAKFTRKLRREEAQVTFPADTVNLVKDFVVENGMHKSSMGKHIVNSRGRAATNANESASPSFAADDGDPNKCQFGRAER
jgi:hypothetical protein